MESGQTAELSIVALCVSVGGIILGIVNHKRIRSRCCGKTMDASLDISATTPPSLSIRKAGEKDVDSIADAAAAKA